MSKFPNTKLPTNIKRVAPLAPISVRTEETKLEKLKNGSDSVSEIYLLQEHNQIFGNTQIPKIHRQMLIANLAGTKGNTYAQQKIACLKSDICQPTAQSESFHSVDVQRQDFEQQSSQGDTLKVRVTPIDEQGHVRPYVASHIIASTGDIINYHWEVEVRNLPFQVTTSIQTSSGQILAQEIYSQSSNKRRRTKAKNGSLRIPPLNDEQKTDNRIKFSVYLQANNSSSVNYEAILQCNDQAVELSRILDSEAPTSQQGMIAVAHLIQNRIKSGRSTPQIDISSPWPMNFINTGFGLNLGRPRSDWRRATSAISRTLAQQIIEGNEVTGADPTNGALYYRAASRPDLEQTRPTFIRLRKEVEAGRMRRITVGGNVFYSPVTK